MEHLRKLLKKLNVPEMKGWLENIFIVVGVILTLVIFYYLGDAFFGLVGDIYRFLDGFIWAFFAGIMAFFLAITISSIIIYILILSTAFAFVALTTIAVAIFGDHK